MLLKKYMRNSKIYIMMNNTKSPLTPTDCILNWNAARQNANSVASLLNNAGNYFLLDTGNISSIFNKLHIYLGCNETEIQLFALPSIADNFKNLQGSFERYQNSNSGKENPLNMEGYINSKLLPIAVATKKEHIKETIMGEPSPGEQQLINSINKWGDEGSISNWIENIFEKGAAEHMIQAFEIDISDFKPGQIHACYFALTAEEVIDLVIVNTETNQILNLFKDKTNYDNTSQFRDLATLVPPFGVNGSSLDYANFGILNALEIE